jgi:hypothetical protein
MHAVQQLDRQSMCIGVTHPSISLIGRRKKAVFRFTAYADKCVDGCIDGQIALGSGVTSTF